MLVALHSAPNGFFKSNPPYENRELFRLVKKAASLGFRYFEVGPMWSFVEIDAKGLNDVLDRYGMKSSVHVGGRYDAEKFTQTAEEYNKAQNELHHGIELCKRLSSELVSFHPPFFMADNARDNKLLSEARSRFLKLVENNIEFAFDNGIKIALESFCYPPFIFNGLHDFMEFISSFPSSKLGVLLEVGHLFHVGLNLDEAVDMFGKRILDVHVHDATLGGDVQEATHLPIGRGKINFADLIKRLREVNYDGVLTLEIRGSVREILESKKCLEHLIESVE